MLGTRAWWVLGEHLAPQGTWCQIIHIWPVPGWVSAAEEPPCWGLLRCRSQLSSSLSRETTEGEKCSFLKETARQSHISRRPCHLPVHPLPRTFWSFIFWFLKVIMKRFKFLTCPGRAPVLSVWLFCSYCASLTLRMGLVGTGCYALWSRICWKKSTGGLDSLWGASR